MSEKVREQDSERETSTLPPHRASPSVLSSVDTHGLNVQLSPRINTIINGSFIKCTMAAMLH